MSPHGDHEPNDGTTGHEWDGIRELDNPLPRWWLIVLWICVAYAVGYWIAMPAWPGVTGYTHGLLGKSDRAELAQDLNDLKTLRGGAMSRLTQASVQQIEADPGLQAFALQAGQSVFGDNCATCHGVGGTGAKGYPNLRDDVWLWGGSLDDIQHTITVGVRSGHDGARVSQMPAFGRDKLLTAAQVSDLTEYVVRLSGRRADAGAVARAAPVFAAQCSACHGPDGRGVQAMGAPNLTDAEWLYGADRASIEGQIINGRGGVMPAWAGRLSPETIKAMAVYIHSNAGGR